MDPKSIYHSNDVRELASHHFSPEIRRYPASAGKTAMLFYAHADEFDRLNQISEFLAQRRDTTNSQSFEIDLTELTPRKDGPGVPFGALVDRPVKFTREKVALPAISLPTTILQGLSVWSCEFAVGSAATTCILHGRGAELIGFELNGETKLADSFVQSDRDFLFQHLFALNKALEAYIKLTRL